MKKKKTGLAFLLLAFILGIVIASPAEAAASQYTGGLLDGEPIQVGPAVGQGTPETKLTDNDLTNNSRIILRADNVAWYTFAAPKEITSVVLKGGGSMKVEFYDDKNNLLFTYNPLTVEGVQTLPAKVSNVSTVVLKTDKNDYVYEWNVFETPSTPPSPTTISWSQAGDSTVTLDWIASGAKTYNVRRSPSPGGPHKVIANIAGTTYTDKAVTNGKTYYYVVTAVNEAGESANSPEISKKPEATQFTGGLLDGVVMDIGKSVNKPERKSKKVTDNNVSNDSRELINRDQFVWHKFAKPEEVNSIVLFTSAGKANIEFYDENDNLLLSYAPLNVNGVQTLPSSVKNVSVVVLKPDNSGVYVNEWNVFRKPSTPPTPTTISWVYGGDKVVKLEWVSTGARAYNVRRSTSPGGPHQVIASNIAGTTYTDKSVENGKTYYYVINAVNEAGESTKSPEKSIQPNATKYTGGLLDARVVNLGPSVGNKVKQTKNLTDNVINNDSRELINVSSFPWYTFSSPKEISSLIVNSPYVVTLELYDDKDNLLLSYKPTKKDEVEMLPEAVKGVKTVVLKPESGAHVYEWNVFGDNPEEPSQEPIQLNAAGGDKQVVLSWSDGNGATGFQVKRSETAGGSYTTITTVSGNTFTYTDTAVKNGKTYYYVVTALYGPLEGVTSNEAFATPSPDGVTPPDPGTEPGTEPGTDPGTDPGTGTKPGTGSGDGQSGNRALLSLILNNGIQKEYDLSMAEVESFIAWYDGRAAGKGSVMFAFDKHNNNKGPFKNRKDYVFYDKIITFEVNGYDVEGTPTGNKEPEHQKPENKQPENKEPEHQKPENKEPEDQNPEYPAEEY
ncbi:fibronectin type III domain-containing protein [Paenibacillus sp. chi10]|uniref:Fibronectin type III domain-containing protein n=1 Tax=Paenibacillus suaedae TaxID=3077233 RepID=A0AAJ2JZU1_9BACL|nr:fibronectin type III domain-containing protein [Paenibacillus sp. chi10]MDT8979496.1 fibronectin type III domain-containing protein [Paenibacillus sp. chi10]